MKVVVASRNKHKVREIAQILTGLDLELVTIDEVAPDAELREDADTFEENAVAKARQAAAATGLPAIGDDSGLEVEVLGGAPGVRSARYGGQPTDDARNNRKLLDELARIGATQRGARFRCVAAYVDPSGGAEIVRSGACEGEILDAPRGDRGFGYDPLFLVPSLGKTMAELPPDQKNSLSHRGAAFRALGRALAEALAKR